MSHVVVPLASLARLGSIPILLLMVHLAGLHAAHPAQVAGAHQWQHLFHAHAEPAHDVPQQVAPASEPCPVATALPATRREPSATAPLPAALPRWSAQHDDEQGVPASPGRLPPRPPGPDRQALLQRFTL